MSLLLGIHIDIETTKLYLYFFGSRLQRIIVIAELQIAAQDICEARVI